MELRDLFPRGASKWADAMPLPVGGTFDAWQLAPRCDNEKLVAAALLRRE